MSVDSRHFLTGQRAFPVYPTAERYFASEPAESARQRLGLCLERGDGPALLLGAAGCGKTMLLEVLATQFAEQLRVVRLASTQLCTRRALLQAILYGLGEPYHEHDEGELRLALIEALVACPNELPPVVLLVDEAQTLPIRLLEELRLLANQSVGGEPRLQLVLAGTGALDEAFTAPELEAFGQRIAARCYLAPLSQEETTHYVRAHVAAAGEDPDRIVDESAYTAIHQASDGVPRLINQVCDRALLWCLQEQVSIVDAASIQAAWSDIHQLPAPWHTPEAPTPPQQETDQASAFDTLDEELDAPGGAIEFGQLSDLLETPIEETKDPSHGCSRLGGTGCGKASCCKAEGVAIDSIWNADEGLLQRDATREMDPEELTLDDDPHAENPNTEKLMMEEDAECIAYAFPTRPELPAPAPSDTPEPTEGEGFGTTAWRDLSEQPDITDSDPEPAEESTDAKGPLVNDPFDEPFDEEEVVLDRYAGIESVLPPGTAVVTNARELDFGSMFQALTPAVECLLDDVAQRIEQPTGFGLVLETQPIEEPTELDAPDEEEAGLSQEHDDSTQDEGLLIIEDTESFGDENLRNGGEPEVHRQEYRQLFASLREG